MTMFKLGQLEMKEKVFLIIQRFRRGYVEPVAEPLGRDLCVYGSKCF